MTMPIAGVAPQAWKQWIGWGAAILTAILFLVSGLWKITDPMGAAVRIAQAKVPESLSLAGAIGLGTTETLTAILVLLPKYRRWGAILASALLLFFMAYIAFFYNDLQGQECSCFPWVKRAVGPGFFIGDAIMLALAALAGVWAARPRGLRTPALILAAVAVFAAGSYAVAANSAIGTPAPATLLVDGQSTSIKTGKVFLYFFDPACMHCLDAGRKMAQMNWGETRVIGVPVVEPQFGLAFMKKSGMNKPISTDWALLKKTFSVKSTPGGVAIENGHERANLTRFEGDVLAATLRKLGFIY